MRGEKSDPKLGPILNTELIFQFYIILHLTSYTTLQLHKLEGILLHPNITYSAATI